MMLGMNIQGARNGLQEEMFTEPKVIRHKYDEDAEGIQATYRRYDKRTLRKCKICSHKGTKKPLVLLMYWVKDQRRLEEMTTIFNGVDEPTLSMIVE